MKLYDTQSRLIKETSKTDGNLTMYCCGPTVYRDAHVGNLRTFMLADLISRVVALSGVKITLIQNITDVGHMSEDFAEDDKILSQASIEKVSPLEVARKYEEKFHIDLSQLNIGVADAYPRASESIDLMQLMIAELIEKQLEKKVVFGTLPDFVTYLGIPFEYAKSLVTKQPRIITLDSIHTAQTGNKVIPSKLAKDELNHNPRPFEETIFDTIDFFQKRGLITK